MAEEAIVMSTTINHLSNKFNNIKITEDNHVATYNLKQGIIKFGDKGVQSARSEVGQLHSRNCFEPIHIHTIISSLDFFQNGDQALI